jgi:hypothetical protein
MLEATANEMSPLIGSGGVTSGTFARIFAEGIVSGVVKILGALAAAAMAAYSLWQLIADIQNNGSISTRVFDGLIFTANLLSAACLVIGLSSSSMFFPIAGAVLAIVGTVLSLIATFEEKPVNPLDNFMQDVGIPFVAALVLPKTDPTPPLVARMAIE